MMQMWVLLASFFLILLAITAINTRVNGGFKVETSWIATALSPTVIWLLATGQLAELGGFGLTFKLREATAKPYSLSLEGRKIESGPVSMDEKGGIGKIDEFIQRRVAAMVLQIGRKGYYSNWAIQEYLQRLTQYDFFRYVVFTGSNGRFQGLVSARSLLDRLQKQNLDLVGMIEGGSISGLDEVITAFVSTNSNKREALKKMDDQNLTELPVVNEAGQFIGITGRDKLISSVVLDLITQL